MPSPKPLTYLHFFKFLSGAVEGRRLKSTYQIGVEIWVRVYGIGYRRPR